MVPVWPEFGLVFWSLVDSGQTTWASENYCNGRWCHKGWYEVAQVQSSGWEAWRSEGGVSSTFHNWGQCGRIVLILSIHVSTSMWVGTLGISSRSIRVLPPPHSHSTRYGVITTLSFHVDSARYALTTPSCLHNSHPIALGVTVPLLLRA